MNTCAMYCHRIDFQGHHQLSEFISSVAPTAGCMTKSEAIAHCSGLNKFYCESQDKCVSDCGAGSCKSPDGTRVWNTNGGSGNEICVMTNGHSCAPGEVYCDIDNQCHYGCDLCISTDGSTKKTVHDVTGNRMCAAPSSETCAASNRVFCPLTNECTYSCEMCIQGGDQIFLAADTVAGATAFNANMGLYKYEIYTKDNNNNINGRSCGTYQDKIAECAEVNAGGSHKWCESESGNGYCVSSCDDCEFSVEQTASETEAMLTSSTETTVESAYIAGFRSGMRAVSGGRVTVKFNEDDNNLCKTNGRQCRVLSDGMNHHYAYCAQINQCVSECSQCPGANFKDSHFDKCSSTPTEYGHFP